MIVKYWIDFNVGEVRRSEFDRLEGDQFIIEREGYKYSDWCENYYDSFLAAQTVLVGVAKKRWNDARIAEAAAMDYCAKAVAQKEA